MKTQADAAIKPVPTVVPQSINGATVTGATVDCNGYSEALVEVNNGAMAGGGIMTVTLQETIEDPASPGTALAGGWADLVDTVAQDPAMTAAFSAMLAAVATGLTYTKRLNLGPRKRFLRAIAVESGSVACLVGVNIILVAPQYGPAVQTQTTQP